MIETIKSSVAILRTFTLINALEVLIIAFLVYEFLLLIKRSRAWTLLKGILVILVFTVLAAIFHLDNIIWILEKISTIAVIGLLVIFQPELRKALEQLGSQKFVNVLRKNFRNDHLMTEESIAQIADAVFVMAEHKTGALIVIENDESLDEYIRTGIAIKGVISSGLLINIFEKNTPLHDGAVIIKDNEVTAATCYLPLSRDDTISKNLGTRHRAALGVSEKTDSLTIVVSEENGHVSVAKKGELFHIARELELKKELTFFCRNKDEKQTEAKTGEEQK